MEYHHIKVEVKDGVQVITLNRPDVLNSFHLPMAREVQDALGVAAADDAIRSVLLTGEGRGFCAGQDLAAVSVDEPRDDLGETVRAQYNPIIRAIRRLEKPVLCAVNGVAAGAGANLAICCDIVVAIQNANFIQAFSKIGLIPDSGGTYILPRLVGFQKATALMMLGDKVSATEAERIGMIYRVFSEEQFEAESFAIAKALANLPPKGLAYTKEALNASLTNTLVEQLNKEDALQFKAANTYDYKEGVRAFLEKRTPVFKGE